MLQLSVYSFSHRFLDLEILGQLVIPETERFQRLSILKEDLKLNEVFYIATCNRVELIMVSDKTLPKSVTGIILHSLNAQLNPQHLDVLARGVQFFSGLNAVNHLMRVSSSLESMVVGEKEILAQVRQHYQTCLEQGLTGDFLRILDKQIVKTAKKVYSQTKIADRPVSIVSLAYRLLKQHNLKKDSRILVIGAGETNQLVAKYLNKQGFKNSVVFNRTESKALELARTLGGKGFGLDALNTYSNGFDIIITCTSAPEPIITETLYAQLLSGDQGQKIIVDLALPADTSKEVSQYKNLIYIELNSLKEMASANIELRKLEVNAAEKIIDEGLKEFEKSMKERQIELAMQMVPSTIKNIRKVAFEEIFVNEISQLDDHSKDVLNKVLDYFEKKYISVPIKAVKNIYIQ